MTLWILLGFVVIAGLQWAVIKRLPFRIARVLVQVPLLALTIIGVMFLLAREQADAEVVAQQVALDRIVERATISRGDVVLSVSATGSITPEQQAPLVFSVTNATVDAINVMQGERVAAGDVLATVVSTDLDQAVDDATVALNLQQISYDVLTQPASAEDIAIAQAQLEAADAQLLAAFSTGTTVQDTQIAFYNTELARNQLWQLQLQRDILADPTPIEIDTEPLRDDIQEDVDSAIQEINRQIRAANAAQARQAENTVIAGEFSVEIADASYEGTLQRGADPGSVAVANAGVTQAEIAYDQLINGPNELQLAQAETQLALATLNLALAEVNLAQTELVAPFDGVIAQSNLTLNELPPQGAAFILIDDSGYFVNLPIDETDIASVAIGQTVTFDVDALPGTVVTGTVESIAYAPLDAEQLGLVAYNVRVEIDLATAIDIRAGMTVTGEIITDERIDVLRVPNQFLRIDRLTGDVFVTVLTASDEFQERQIALGARNDVFSEVVMGLEAGDEVVLLPQTGDDEGIGG